MDVSLEEEIPRRLENLDRIEFFVDALEEFGVVTFLVVDLKNYVSAIVGSDLNTKKLVAENDDISVEFCSSSVNAFFLN